MNYSDAKDLEISTTMKGKWNNLIKNYDKNFWAITILAQCFLLRWNQYELLSD